MRLSEKIRSGLVFASLCILVTLTGVWYMPNKYAPFKTDVHNVLINKSHWQSNIINDNREFDILKEKMHLGYSKLQKDILNVRNDVEHRYKIHMNRTDQIMNQWTRSISKHTHILKKTMESLDRNVNVLKLNAQQSEKTILERSCESSQHILYGVITISRTGYNYFPDTARAFHKVFCHSSHKLHVFCASITDEYLKPFLNESWIVFHPRTDNEWQEYNELSKLKEKNNKPCPAKKLAFDYTRMLGTLMKQCTSMRNGRCLGVTLMEDDVDFHINAALLLEDSLNVVMRIHPEHGWSDDEIPFAIRLYPYDSGVHKNVSLLPRTSAMLQKGDHHGCCMQARFYARSKHIVRTVVPYLRKHSVFDEESNCLPVDIALMDWSNDRKVPLYLTKPALAAHVGLKSSINNTMQEDANREFDRRSSTLRRLGKL